MDLRLFPLLALALAGCGGRDAQPAPDAPARAASRVVDVGAGPRSAVTAFGRVWVSAHNSDAVVGIGPDGKVAERFEVKGEPTGIAAGHGALWTSTPLDGGPKLRRIDPRSGDVTSIALPAPGSEAPVAAAGAIWLVLEGGVLVRVDPRTKRLRRVLRLPAEDANCAGFIASAHRSLWITSDCGGPHLLRVDPRRERVVARISVRDEYLTGVVADGDDVWALTQSGQVLRIDARRDRVAAAKQVGDTAGGLWAGRGSLWVRPAADRLLRVDPKTLEVEREHRLPEGPMAGGVAAGALGVWAMNFTAGTVTRVE